MDEDQWQLLEDLKEGIDELNINIKIIAEVMLYNLKKRYGDYVEAKKMIRDYENTFNNK